jgi:Zn-dependent peptidase ImmA (M78 family)
MSSQAPAHVQGTQAARALRHREQLGFEAVDVWQVLERLHVAVAIHEFGEDAGDGLYLWENDEPLIVVNASKRPSRQRFTAAHELGHHEMHRFDGDVLLADEDIFKSSDNREVAANAFAAYFLAPDEALDQKLGKRIGEDILPDLVVDLMPIFGLSYEALTFRLLNIHRVNKAQRAGLMQDANVEERMRRVGINEDPRAPSHLPRGHINATLRLYEDHVVTPDRMAELLDMSHDEAISFAHERGVTPSNELSADERSVEALLHDA